MKECGLPKKMVVLFFSLLCWQLNIVSGFVAGTLVKTPDGYVSIEQLHVGDQVVSFVHYQQNEVERITHKTSAVSHNVYYIKIADDSFIVDGQQKFYDPFLAAWISTQDLTDQNVFLDSRGCFHPCVSVAKTTKTVSMHEISVQEPHTFFVGKTEIVAHNFVSAVLGISFAFGGGLSLEGISLALGGIGIAAYNFFKGKKKIKFKLSFFYKFPFDATTTAVSTWREFFSFY